MFHHLKKFLRDESGPTAVEYSVMLALIVLACIVAIRAMGNNASDSFTDSASQIAAAMAS